MMPPNKIVAGNRYRAFQLDDFAKFLYPHCSQGRAPLAVPELWTLGRHVRP